jgi:hypothetical protein
MVGVRHVRVLMPQGFVPVRVTVFTHRQLVMGVQMVAIVMAVGVFMLKWPVVMLVGMILQQMQHHSHQHQDAT